MSEEKPDVPGSTGGDAEAPKPTPKPKPAADAVGPEIRKAAPAEVGAVAAAKPVPPKPQKKEDGLRRTAAADESDSNIWRYSRRDFFAKIGWLSIFSFMGVMLVGTLRYMFPRVLFEPSPIFRAGFPEEYLPGTVSTKWMKEFRVWVIRDTANKIYVLSGICTHLGCTPRWLEQEDKFKCPCHGSGFYRSGINFEGPAPRALERLKVSRAEDGTILIDKSIKFLYEKDGWENPQSYITV